MIILSSPSETAFTLCNIPIYYYGLILSFGALIGFYCSFFVAKKYYFDIDANILYDIVPLLIVIGFISARLYYCLINIDYYSIHLNEILNFRQGGLAIHGGIIGSFAGLCILAKIKKISILKLSDILVFGLVIAQSIGRWGNFFNNEAYGLPTDKFIAVYIPEHARILGYESFNYFQPTFLYESICNLFIFFVLLYVAEKFKNKFDGLILSLYLILYSIIRFFIEGYRLDCTKNVGYLHFPQVISVIMFFIGIILIIALFNKKHIIKS
ncbi:prolipoprotein diacylglyceryl transferase [bacterium]|nr:prolipoprotein diacylglyceryl transferase [bacterium]